MTSAVTVEPLKPATRGLLCCSAAAGPLFVTVFVLEGARRPDYNPLRHPVSSLALGSRGWVQVANFAVAGTLYLAGAAGLMRTPDPILGTRLGPALLVGVGLGLLGSAAFCTDPVSGYPPGTPDAPSDPAAARTMHNIAALPIFLGIPAVTLVCAWRFHQDGRRGWGLYSAATGVSTLIGMALFGAGFSQASPRLTDRAGLLQRATIATGFGWLTALSTRTLRRSSRLR
ncbi:MAG: DUF998 domain-containing protein [Solirubrobacteraceae bacterium]